METESNLAKTKYYTASFHNGGRKEDAKDTKGTKKGVKFQANREHNIRDEEYCKSQEHIGFKNKTEQEHREWEKTHVFIDEKPEDAYERIFGEAIKKYDAKQKRSDRRIGNGKKYYEKIKKSQKKVPVYEFIITLGNKNNLPENPENVRQLYIEYLNNFIQRNPNFEVIGAYYHDDESRDDGKGGRIPGAPHLHVDYIPVSRNRWQKFLDSQNKKQSLVDKLTGKEVEKKTRVNGLDVENSLTEALEGQGFKNMELDPTVIEKKFGIHISERHYKDPERQAQYEEFMKNRTDENGKKIKTRLLTAQMQWIKNERDCLIRMFEKNGYKIKNPGEHRPHLETDDYIEQQDQNIQEQNLKLYNELSTKLDFLENEEKELVEKEKQLNEKEEQLKKQEQKQKEIEINQENKDREQIEKNTYLETKTKIVEEAEQQLEEAEQQLEESKIILAKAEELKNDINLIKQDLYNEIKTQVDSEYTTKYNELYEVQEYQEQQADKLFRIEKIQKEQEQELNQKKLELTEKEKKVSNLENEKKALIEKEQELNKLNEYINNKTEELKKYEKILEQNTKELEKREEELSFEIREKDIFFDKQQKIFEENKKFITAFNVDYESKTRQINEWSAVSTYLEEIKPEDWVEKTFNTAVAEKHPRTQLIKKLSDGIKGFVAGIKKRFNEILHGTRRFSHTHNGEIVCSYTYGTQDYTEMLLDTPIDDIQKSIDDCRKKGKNTIREIVDNEGLEYLEKHYKRAKQIKREITIELERQRSLHR